MSILPTDQHRKENSVRKDMTFSDRKLTEAEFSEKYWLDGIAPYQYHTATIDDGRDEREQFHFNNCRALYELLKFENRELRTIIFRLSKSVEYLQKRLDLLEPRNQSGNLAGKGQGIR